jgi:hypothetical protein
MRVQSPAISILQISSYQKLFSPRNKRDKTAARSVSSKTMSQAGLADSASAPQKTGLFKEITVSRLS